MKRAFRLMKQGSFDDMSCFLELACSSIAVGDVGAEVGSGGEMNTLNNVKVGQYVLIKKLHGEGAVRRHIMDLGLTKGTTVFVRKLAPLGDPIELTLRDYELSIRKEDAMNIEVEVVEA